MRHAWENMGHAWDHWDMSGTTWEILGITWDIFRFFLCIFSSEMSSTGLQPHSIHHSLCQKYSSQKSSSAPQLRLMSSVSLYHCQLNSDLNEASNLGPRAANKGSQLAYLQIGVNIPCLKGTIFC